MFNKTCCADQLADISISTSKPSKPIVYRKRWGQAKWSDVTRLTCSIILNGRFLILISLTPNQCMCCFATPTPASPFERYAKIQRGIADNCQYEIKHM